MVCITMVLRTLFLLLAFSLASGTTIPAGIPANDDARSPSISADGRFIAFESDATNLASADDNGLTDIFVYDRQNDETFLVSVSPSGQQGDGDSRNPVISGNGRFVVFESDAANLVPGDTNGLTDIFSFDRLTGLIRRVSVGRLGEESNGKSHSTDVDHAGRYIVYQSDATNLIFRDENAADDVFIYDTLTENVILASAAAADGRMPDISGDGRFVAFTTSENALMVYHRVLATTTSIGDSDVRASVSFTGGKIAFISSGRTMVYDRDLSAALPLPLAPTGATGVAISDDAQTFLISGVDALFLVGSETASELYNGSAGSFDLSSGGESAVFDATIAGLQHRQIVVEGPPVVKDSFHLAGRVTDALGRPLSLVTISDGIGRSTRTDRDGYFYLSGFPGGTFTLTPAKEGYTFDPEAWNLSVIRDVAGYLFIASPEEKLLEEARKDLGMPYNFNRGCDDPYIGCGKAFHGFAAGFCTDLVLDAYTYGVAYDINYALQQDAYAHPEHFYRWRDARNTHDMWRFFFYTGQLIDHSEDYLPGDAVFFDWSGDGEIDHVAIVSEVANGRPVQMIDATGVTEQNPTGLAAELDWLAFHENTVRGHARWDGSYEPVRSGYPDGARVLQTALSGGGIFMRIVDERGRAVSFGEQSVPGAKYYDLDWEETISFLEPGGRYIVEIRSITRQPVPYIFTVQTLSGGLITGRFEVHGEASPDEVVRIEWRVGEDPNGMLFLKTDSGLRHARIRGVLRKP